MNRLKGIRNKTEPKENQRDEISQTKPSKPFPVIFNVMVPNDPTAKNKPVFLVGSFKAFSPNLPDWDPHGLEMKQLSPNRWSITIMGQQRTEVEYKYTLGNWNQVETDDQGNDIANRRTILNSNASEIQEIQDTVKAWRK